MKSNKILNIVIAAIAIIGAILFIRIFSADDMEAYTTDADLQNGVISPLISFSTILFYATVVITIVLSIWTIIRNPENLKKMLMSLAILGGLLLISYFIADADAVYDANGLKVLPGGEEGSATNKWVGTGIWFSVILGAIASVFFVIDLGKGLIKS